MLHISDYAILDSLMEACEVVDFDFRYRYINDPAMEREHLSKEQMLGQAMLELHPEFQSTLLLIHLKTCMAEQKSIEFEDTLSYPNSSIATWKIKIDPIPDGALIHSVPISKQKTKVRVKRKREPFTHHNTIQELSQSLDVEGWLDSLDSRTRESSEHILRVTNTTVILAQMAGLPANDIIQIRRGSLLHDIGKTGISDLILLKAGKLTDNEWDVIRMHPVYAHDLVYPIEYLRSCLSIPYCHHEKWDGTGYPQGLKGDEIPLAARLFSVVDVWDSLSFDRVYRKAWSHEDVMSYLRGQSGSHFDPDAVDLFFRVEDLFKLSP